MARQIYSWRVRLLLIGGSLVGVMQASAARAQPAPLCPSVLMFHKPHHTNGVAQVERIAELGFGRAQVVVTLHCRIDKQGRVARFGLGSGRRFRPLNEATLGEFRMALHDVFAAAADHDLQLAIVAHLNAAGPVYDWRNNFDVDPLASYAGYSYDQAMIESVVGALAEAMDRNVEVEFALAGEMGRSVFQYANSYGTIVDRLRRDARLPNLSLGVSLNFTLVAGEDASGNQTRMAAQELFDRCDFVAMSNYRAFVLPPRAAQFRQSIDQFLVELEAAGVRIDRDKPLQISEIGLGGGSPGKLIAESPVLAAKTPWEGSDRRQENPWRDAEMRQLRRDFHRELLDFLANQSSEPRVSAAYLWSEGSWDPLGTLDRGFEDVQIAEMIGRHNNAALDHPAPDHVAPDR